MSEDPQPHNWAQTRTLYVVLQGEFALFHQVNEDSKCDTLRILAPYIKGHQYKAGPWLTNWKDAPEVPRILSLENAVGDRKRNGEHCARSIPENNLDIIVTVGAERLCPGNARLDISAPMPLAILPGLIETNPPTVEITVKQQNGPDAHPPVPKRPTVIPILVYKWFADSRPYLWDAERCKKWISGGPSDDFQSIHIFASSPCSDDEDIPHAEAAFAAAADLLGQCATINLHGGGSPTLIAATPPAGLSWAQVNMFFSDVLNLDPCDPQLIADDAEAIKAHIDFASSGNCGPITGG